MCLLSQKKKKRLKLRRYAIMGIKKKKNPFGFLYYYMVSFGLGSSFNWIWKASFTFLCGGWIENDHLSGQLNESNIICLHDIWFLTLFSVDEI